MKTTPIKITKRDLAQALKSAGGTAKLLAKELGVTAPTVRKWLKTGVPKRSKGRALIAGYKKKRVDTRSSKSSDLKKLKAMLKKAVVKTAGQKGGLAPVRTFTKAMDGPLAVGRHWAKAFKRELTLPFINEIERWARSHAKVKPYWLMNVRVAQFSQTEDFIRMEGSPKLELKLRTEVFIDDPDANLFIAEQLVVSPRRSSMRDLLAYLRRELESAVETSNTVYVLAVNLYNYRLRTKVERKARLKEYNRKRKATWKAKTNKMTVERKKKSAKKTKRKRTSML